MSGTTLTERPFKGLMPYEEADALFFFGREADCGVISSNLLASRLTILYGPSGVGKSSVLDAGVVYHVRQVAQDNLKEIGKLEFTVVVHRSWHDDPGAGLLAGVQVSVEQILGRRFDPVPPGTALADALAIWAERLDGTLLIILDQFEEYFLYHPREDGPGTFATEFPAAVNRPDLRVNVLLSLREDALAKLDRFEGKIRSLFDNYLRLAPLDREAAVEALRGPIAEYNRHHEGQPVTIEPKLIDEVLAQVKAGAVELVAAGRGVVAGVGDWDEPRDIHIETSYLQLVMTRLWDEEQHLGSRTLRWETFTQKLGGARAIVRKHFDDVMGWLSPTERAVASDVLPYLVTPSGAKIAQEPAFIAARTGRPADQIEAVLSRLASQEGRILRKVDSPSHADSYEIFHDVLARVILDYVTVQDAERAKERIRRQFFITAGLAVGLILALLLSGFAWWQWGEAKKQARRAQRATEKAEAINNFLLNDMLAQAAPELNARARRVTVEEVLDRAAARIDKVFADQPEVQAAIRVTIGMTYWKLGKFANAEPPLRHALESRRQVLGAEHPDTLMTMNNLAQVLQDRGQLEEAEALERQVLEARRRILGPEHPDTLMTMNNLALVLRDRGQLEEAEALERQVLEARRRIR